jgi:hypothetical protein
MIETKNNVDQYLQSEKKEDAAAGKRTILDACEMYPMM